MIVEREKLKSLVIDVEKNRFELNGEPMKCVSRMDLDFDNGKWTLLVTKDVLYDSTAPDETTEYLSKELAEEELQMFKSIAQSGRPLAILTPIKIENGCAECEVHLKVPKHTQI